MDPPPSHVRAAPVPAAERRWSGAFRTCAACGERNFVGRSICTRCGTALRQLLPAAPPAASSIGRRGSDRFQGRGVAVAGGAVALVALVAGTCVYRSMRGPDWAPIPGAAMRATTGRAPSPAWEMEAPALPDFPRPEDRASYEKGRRLLAAGDAKGALGPLTEAARRLPGEPVVVHDYGLALVRAGHEDLGLFQLEHASRLAPGIGSYRLDLIRAFLAAGRRGPAVRELEELVARDPTNAAAAELLASLTDATVTSAGGASPGPAPESMDLGGAAGGADSPRPEGGAAFTNEDLGRRRTAPPAPVTPAPAVAAPNASSPALLASPSPPA